MPHARTQAKERWYNLKRLAKCIFITDVLTTSGDLLFLMNAQDRWVALASVLARKFKSPVIYVCENLEKRISVYYWKGQILREWKGDEWCVVIPFMFSSFLSVFFLWWRKWSSGLSQNRGDWQNKLYVLLPEREFKGTRIPFTIKDIVNK